MVNNQLGVQQPNTTTHQASRNVQGASLPPPEIVQARQKGMFMGHLNRVGFLLSIIYIIAFFLAPILMTMLARLFSTEGQIINIVSLLWSTLGVILAIPVAVSVSVRRWHDLNQSGALVLLYLIPLVGLITFFIQLLAPGDKTGNKYGNPDTKPPTIAKVLLGR